MLSTRGLAAPLLLVALSLQLAAGLPNRFKHDENADDGHSRIIRVGNCIGNRCAVSNLALSVPRHGSTDYSPVYKPWRRMKGADSLLSKMVASKKNNRHNHHLSKRYLLPARVVAVGSHNLTMSEQIIKYFIFRIKTEKWWASTEFLDEFCRNMTKNFQIRNATCIVRDERRGITIPERYGTFLNRRDADETETHPWLVNITRATEDCDPAGGLNAENVQSWTRCICTTASNWNPDYEHYTDFYIMGPSVYFNLSETAPTCRQMLSVTKREAPGTVPGHLMPSVLGHYKMFGECEPQSDGRKRYYCPTPVASADGGMSHKCITMSQICNQQEDCPGGEDEGADGCFFYRVVESEVGRLGHSVNELVTNAFTLPHSPSSSSTSSHSSSMAHPSEVLGHLGLDAVPGGPTFTHLPDSGGHDYEDSRHLRYGDHSELPDDVQAEIAKFLERDAVRIGEINSATTTTTEAPPSSHHYHGNERRTLQDYKGYQRASGWV